MTNEPTVGPSSPDEMPTTMYVKHKHMPDLEKAAPGDPVSFVVHGHVHSNRAGRKDGSYPEDGEAQVDVHKIEPHMAPKKKKNAANMPMDELKNVIKASEGHDDKSNS